MLSLEALRNKEGLQVVKFLSLMFLSVVVDRGGSVGLRSFVGETHFVGIMSMNFVFEFLRGGRIGMLSIF